METTTKPGQLHRDLQERGYSNLTAAIKDEQCIDWEQLDGLTVWCANPTVGALRGTLKRYALRLALAHTPHGWYDESMDKIYTSALIDAWHGENNWVLWLESEIPLRRKTANELKVGTYFLGKTPDGSPCKAYVGQSSKEPTGKVILLTPVMIDSGVSASEWEVIEEYRSFLEPEGE